MGFGALTRVEIDQLDREVLKWIIYNYDPESSTLNIRSRCYSVNDEDVKIALGVPATSQTIILHTKGTDGLKKYGHLFKIIDGRIDIVTLVGSLKQCTSAGDEFKVMYLALLFGTVLFPSTQHNLPVHYLNPLVVIENIKELNWAGLIRTTLNEGIRKWKNTEHAYIGGSLVFLQHLKGLS
ncbi:PREDICTED: uncharacterized protein LOC105976121 [Erythranthe guttata]|uniref:uncharacterized protein LOC105976121 n=1 Tax=Erythranthe guttata TaxID=4155 RepID=UPI00064D936A|nr:PREDICTED: uncharacterized protein LOC105976121 [Erythranthe guttata]|eukprot:XP_012856891.1 PREDICTED: uncharacterized protein LOC105976121 [Erythranthe guttata]